MADEARATARVDAETGNAKQEISGLRGIFGSFFEGLREGAMSVEPANKQAGSSFSGMFSTVTSGLFSFNQLAEAGRNVRDALGAVFGVAKDVVGGVFNIVKGVADAGDKFFTLSRQTGLGAEALSAFAYIGEQTGTTTEGIAANVFKMGVNIEKGGKQTESAFRAIGLSTKELRDLKPDEQFTKIMEGMQGIPDAGQRALVGTTIFGKGFKSIAQLVDEDLVGLADNARTFGLVMSDEMAAAGDAFGDTMSDVNALFTGMKNILGSALLPIMNAFTGTIRDELVVVFKMLKDAFGPLFAGFGGFSKGLQDTAQSADLHGKVLKFLITVIAGLVDAFAGIIRAVGSVMAAYYEFRIASNLIGIAFNKVVEGILVGAKLILDSMAKITPGEAGKQFAKWADQVGVGLDNVRESTSRAKAELPDLEAKSKTVSTTMGAFADKLNLGADSLRKQAAEYKGTATAQEPLKRSTQGLGDDFDEMGGAAAGAEKKVSDFVKTSTREIADLKKEWDKQPPAVRANTESITVLLEKYEKLRANATGPLPKDLEALRTQFQKAIPTNEKYAENLNQIGHNVGLIAEPMSLAGREAQGLTEDWKLQSTALQTNVGLMPGLKSGLMQTRDAEKAAAIESDNFWNSLDQLAGSFAQLAQIMGGGAGGITQMIGQTIGAISLGAKAADGFTSSLDALKSAKGIAGVATGAAGMVANLGGMVGAMQQATNHGSAAANALGGMSAGMAMGAKVAGPWGAAVGAAVGAIWGAFKGKPEWSKIQADIQRDFGIAVTETLAKEIEKTSKEVGDRTAAIALNLNKLVEESGGITTANIEQFMPKVRDLFSLVETKKITLAQANEQLSATFPQLAAAATSANGLVSKSLLEIIALNDRFGTNSKEVADFVRSNMTSAMGGLTTFLNSSQISSQQTAEAMGASVSAVFAKMSKDSGNAAATLAQMNPVIVALQKQFDATGFTGGAAFEKISALSKTASDDIVSKAMTSVSGLTDLMKGLHNSGLMDQDMFTGLSAQIGTTWQGLIDQGKDGDHVMQLMQPTLQMLWEAQQKFGFTVDDTTQRMLNQAQTQGVVGAQYVSTEDRMIQVTEHLDSVLTAMARKMGVEVAGAADVMGNRGVNAAYGIAGAMGGVLAPNADNVINKLNGTPWEGYQNRAAWAAQVAAGNMAGLGGAINNVGGLVNANIGVWGRWEDEARGAAAAVRREVDAISFGESPGGIKEWIPMLTKARNSFSAFGSDATSTLRRVKGEVNSLGAVNSADSLDFVARGRAGNFVGGGGGTVINVDAKGAVFEEEATVRRMALRIGDKIADQHFRGTKVGIT